MRERSGSSLDGIKLAVEAAEQVFDPKLASDAPLFEPTNVPEARAAVQRLGELFEELPVSIAEALGAARSTGSLLSANRLQGLVEIIQNADDAEASEVRFQLRPNDLLVAHNGNPLRLKHVLSLATPWLSTKTGEVATIGRFGIGLSTLRSLSTTLEVHCTPYHIRIGEPTVAPIEVRELPPWFREPGWTTFRIPLETATLQSSELKEWIERWDDSALLFLRHVARVTLVDLHGGPIGQLELSRQQDGDVGSGPSRLARGHAETADGRTWAIYSAEVPSPPGLQRAEKATGANTPVAVALPLGPAEAGQVYAGLPVTRIGAPLFANAQFDPLASRTDFADSKWNQALARLVAEVWAEAVLDLFGRAPQAAWHAMPLPPPPEGNVASNLVQALEAAILEKARQVVGSRLAFPVPGQGQVGLSQLAVEARPLEGLLHEGEIARLADVAATLPSSVRDREGRWRLVMEDWRNQRTDLPRPVSVAQALTVVGDAARPIGSTIELVAAALREGLGARLLELRCVIAHDGRRVVPPAPTSTKAVAVATTPLAERLGVATLIHPAHLAEENGAPEVLHWLRECGALLDGSDDGEVLRRLAKAGQAGRSLRGQLTGEQVRALRDAFERLDRRDGEKLGPDVGRAVRLESYRYDGKGGRQVASTRPADAYLPRAIDRERDGLAVAAGESQRIMWLSDRYSRTLRSDAGREGLGALGFLRLLGAETAPRLRSHPHPTKSYQNDVRHGVHVRVPGAPPTRLQALRARGAEYTLQDYVSPDLQAVIEEIAHERQGKRRRERAGAILAALGRAWNRRLREFAQVDAAAAKYRWVPKGKVPAFWLLQAGDVAWLDDESGTPRKPCELRVRTPGNEAIYGVDSPDYLHADLARANRPALLTALGVSSDPSRSEMVGRLRELRSASYDDGVSSEEQRHEAARVYRSLAQGLAGEVADSDLTPDQLRAEFARYGLLLTNVGWLPPRSVLRGPPIFGDLRAFAPAIARCGPLWRALQLRPPLPNDCLDVLRQIANRRTHAPDTTEEVIILETLRVLSDYHAREVTVDRRKLARLALWTSNGWRRDRPVFATDDRVIAEGLGDRVPIWQPGGGLEQFRSILEPLRLTEIDTRETAVVEPDLALEAPEMSGLFREAVELLRDDLQRNDPQLAESLTVPWSRLATYAVKVHPSLTLAVRVDADQTYECAVDATVDTNIGTVFVTNPEVLTRVDGGGRALAVLFKTGARLVAQAWRAACDQAEAGIKARALELARERAEREEAEVDAHGRLAELQEKTARKQRSSRGRAGKAAGKPGTHRPGGDGRAHREPGRQASPLRTLVDPQSLVLVDARGRINRGAPNGTRRGRQGTARGGSLNDPKRGSRGPRNRTPLRAYSDIDKEDVGLELLRMLLSSDEEQIADIRAQRRVGADAVDELGKYYELKVSAGAEPNEVTLTDAEVQRAHATDGFFLVVISNLEEGRDGQPTVRIVADPLNQLRPTERGSITLSGLAEAESLVYHFADDVNSADDDDQ